MNRNKQLPFIWQLSPRIPFTRLNIVCKEIRKITTEGTILDLGCGHGQSAQFILSKVKGHYILTGLDAFLPDIIQAKELDIYSNIVLYDLNKPFPFAEKTFDIVLLLEVLEHFPREDGERLLAKMEAIARKGVIISTPGFLDRTRIGTETEDTAYYMKRYKNEPLRMPHVTIWTEEDYRNFGYNVKRVNGIHIPRLPPLLNQVFGVFSAPFAYFFLTHMSEHFVAIKRTQAR